MPTIHYMYSCSWLWAFNCCVPDPNLSIPVDSCRCLLVAHKIFRYAASMLALQTREANDILAALLSYIGSPYSIPSLSLR